MKLKGVFTHRGAMMLERAFLPTIEKFGKTCQLLVTPEQFCLVQTALNTDGAHVCARINTDVLYEAGTFHVQSRHHNLIAFSVDVPLFLTVLRSMSSNGVDRIETKLTQRALAMAGQDEPELRPFLSFTARGPNGILAQLAQDLPVSKPFVPSEIDRVAAAKAVTSYAPLYLDLLSGGGRLQAIIGQLKAIGPVLNLATCNNGDLHIQVTAINALLGTQLQGLSVVPASVTHDPSVVDRAATAEEQLSAALSAGEAQQVQLSVKHLAKVLSVHPLSSPFQILCGIAPNRGHVHVMFIFKDPAAAAAFDDSIELTFKLPVREDDD